MPKNSNEPVFDKARWQKTITKPDWYIDFLKEAQQVEKTSSKKTLDKFRKDSRHFFEAALERSEVFLAKDGPNLDIERQPIDTVVIHHTSHQPGYRLSYLNAVHMLVIYSPYFVNPTVPGEESLKGQPLWSGHFKDGKQVFWGYHWLMRMDGQFERLLEDNVLGWHAGNWQVNRRSAAICLDNDYEEQDPTDQILEKLVEHIKRFYPDVKTENIIGHGEARKGTTCPGTHFLERWKPLLLEYFA